MKKQVDVLNEMIDKNIKYISRHFYSKNIIKRILWKLLGWKTFCNIVWDVADIFFHRGQVHEKQRAKGDL